MTERKKQMSRLTDKSITEIIQDLFETVRELELRYPGRKFTVDGHLLGSIGEVIAAEYYGLTLLKNSSETHDAVDNQNRHIQIKATQIKRVSISSEPDYLIVIQITPDGEWTEIYNGKGSIVWNNAGALQKNGQRPISIAKLKKLMDTVPESEKISHK